MSQDAFRKFVNPKKNSVIKEEFRQDKKKARKEKREYFEAKKAEEYKARQAKRGAPVKEAAPVAKAVGGNTAKAVEKKQLATETVMPLNKFLAHCGICSRRDAVAVIAEGNVKVNGKVATEPGYKVQPTDEIIYNGKTLFVTKNLVYILVNKPKDYITTTDDPQGRKTVLQLIQKATAERVYPIGRLDRNTSGVLLITNDGDLTQKLSHPTYEITKIYEVKLDKQLTKAHFDDILKGLILEDGLVLVDSLAYADAKDKSVIGIEIHSGRNRIVRRIFESLGYDVKGLDRVMYAGLTKKNVERGKWRYLSEKEIRVLKYMNESKNRKGKPAAASVPEAPKEKKLSFKEEARKITDADISAAIGEDISSIKKDKPAFNKDTREDKVKKAGKFKTHSEKKKAADDETGSGVKGSFKKVDKEAKVKQPRKFKTHSEKKKAAKEGGKK